MGVVYIAMSASVDTGEAQRRVAELEPQWVLVWQVRAPLDESSEKQDLLGYVYPAATLKAIEGPPRPLGDVLGVGNNESADMRLPYQDWSDAPDAIEKIMAQYSQYETAQAAETAHDTSDASGAAREAFIAWSQDQPSHTRATPPSETWADHILGSLAGGWGSVIGGAVGASGGVAAGPADEPGNGRPAEMTPQAVAAAPSTFAVAVDYPISVAVGDLFSVLVSVTVDEADVNSIPFAAVPDEVVDVVVVPVRGFVLEGNGQARLTVTKENNLPQQIRLTPATEGPGEITCYAFKDGSPLGSLTIRPEVTEQGTGTGEPRSAAAHVSDTARTRADLELIVFEEPTADGRRLLRYYLNATDPELGLNLKQFGPVTLEASPAAYFASLYQEVSDIPVDTGNLRQLAAERVAAIGARLFTDLFPDDLQVLLWGLQARIGSVLIQSVEPWIPWELCRLQGNENGRIVEGPFLCEAFEVTRWLPDLRRIPTLTATTIGIIQPPSDLASAPEEKLMVQKLTRPGLSVHSIPPNYSGVRSALSSGEFDVVHFVGHGRFPNPNDGTRAELSLAGSQVLRPTDISGEARNLGVRKPIILLNACQSGQKGLALTGTGGWALAMLQSGAGAFIGAFWDVTDSLALAFAREFYTQILAGASMATAVRAARLSIRDEGDPTWLAYTVYADPHATVQPIDRSLVNH